MQCHALRTWAHAAVDVATDVAEPVLCRMSPLLSTVASTHEQTTLYKFSTSPDHACCRTDPALMPMQLSQTHTEHPDLGTPRNTYHKLASSHTESAAGILRWLVTRGRVHHVYQSTHTPVTILHSTHDTLPRRPLACLLLQAPHACVHMHACTQCGTCFRAHQPCDIAHAPDGLAAM